MVVRSALDAVGVEQNNINLPEDPSWVLPPAVPYTLGLSNFPVGVGCHDPNVTGFDVIGFYGDWGSCGVLEVMMKRRKHKQATAEKFQGWLEDAGFKHRNRVWHINVLLVLRNCDFSAAKKSESGDHRMYRDHELMLQSAVINGQVERVARPRLHVTLGIAAAVAFCHTHPGADPEQRFAKYSRDRSQLRNFALSQLYEQPHPLTDGSIVVQLCHPDNIQKNSKTRRERQPGYTDDVALLKSALAMAGLFTVSPS